MGLRLLGGQEALAEAAQCLEFWPWLKPEETYSLRMGRVWRPVEEEETVGEKRRGEKGSGSSAGPTQGEGNPQKPYHLGKNRIGWT